MGGAGAATACVRYAIQRRQAEVQERELYRAQVRDYETSRLERALLPTPLVGDGALEVLVGLPRRARRPARRGLLRRRRARGRLGRRGRRRRRGPRPGRGGARRDAAHGVAHRGARGAAAAAQVLDVVEQILAAERGRPEIFATARHGRGQPGPRLAGPVPVRPPDAVPARHADDVPLPVRPARPGAGHPRAGRLAVPSASSSASAGASCCSPTGCSRRPSTATDQRLGEDGLAGADGGAGPGRAGAAPGRTASGHDRATGSWRPVRCAHGGNLVDDTALVVLGWSGTR